MSQAPTSTLPGVEGGNYYDKYASKNPIERRLVGSFTDAVLALARRSGAAEAHEVGCGEAELTVRLASQGLRIRGSDVSSEAIEMARERTAGSPADIPLEAKGIFELDPDRDGAELIVCCEVLEHLTDPAGALEILATLARPWLLASVPREPIWRAMNLARGSYVRDLGNTPGHLNHFSRRSFLRFLERRFELVEVRSPLPWTVVLCRVAG